MIIRTQDINYFNKYDHIILGCGIAGFSCGYFLKKFNKKLKILFIESGN